jgi:hypothetical protein
MIAVDRSTSVRPLHPASALVLALADWLGLVLNVVTAMDAYWPVVLGCALASTFGIALIEGTLEREPKRSALLKASALSILIVLPLPLAGSLAAFCLLIWWCVN